MVSRYFIGCGRELRVGRRVLVGLGKIKGYVLECSWVWWVEEKELFRSVGVWLGVLFFLGICFSGC